MTVCWTPISIIVPSELRSKCGKFGYDIVQHIKANRMDGRKINRDWLVPMKQAMSKLAEVAGAIACGCLEGIDWDYTRPDPGYDFLIDGVKVDVKGTDAVGAKRLLYPVDKTQDFDRQDVDVFLMVWAAKHDTKNFGYCEVRGWSFKDEFKANKHIVTKADWKVFRMTAGTWALPQAYLMPMAILVGRKWRDAGELRAKTFGYTGGVTEAHQAVRGDGGMEDRSREQAMAR